MTDPADPRLHDLSALVLRLALGEYGARGEPSLERDEIDALIVGLNLLAETLQIERDAREEAETLLRDERHAYDHAPGMFCSLDAASFELIKSNQTFADALAIDRDQLVGRSLVDLVDPRERSALTETLTGIRDGEDPPKTDFTLRAADGVARPVLLSASVVENAAGDPARLRVILRDVSRERSLEEQVRQGQKMDAIGRLASGIAHDFNNILTVIIGATEQVQLRIGSHPAGEMLEMILDAGERAAKLTQQLLTFGRSDLVNPEIHDLNALIRDTLPMLRRPLAGRASLDLSLGLEPLFIRIDVTQLTQLLLNLTFNAVDAIEANGTVRIATSRSEKRAVRLVVSDDGSGMDPDVLERACEPFFTTKDASGGSGLGLAVCYGIATRAGGDLTIASTPGAGTTVTLTFPAASPEPRADRSPAPRAARAPLARRRILVVDDSDPVRRLVVRALSEVGHDVLEASGASEALELLEVQTVDLLVTDVVMPGQGGGDLARGAWARHPDLPVIFVSGYTGDRLGEAVLEKPHVRFLQKPFRAERLAELAETLLDDVTNP